MDLLRRALEILDGTPVNVDASVIAEQPRLSGHRDAMETSLSRALGAPVSVKATTNEGMGWIGRGEGLACTAVALVESKARENS